MNNVVMNHAGVYHICGIDIWCAHNRVYFDKRLFQRAGPAARDSDASAGTAASGRGVTIMAINKKQNTHGEDDFYSIAWSPDGAQIATLHELAIRVWDSTSGNLIKTYYMPHDVGLQFEDSTFKLRPQLTVPCS